MKFTIFNTPIFTPVLRAVTKVIMRLVGWRVEGKAPQHSKYIWIGAPHTSNWDFMLMLALGLCLKEDFRYMGKAELFRSPIGFFFYWCGGIPVDRSKSSGLVEQMIEAMNSAPNFNLAIAPEGTRDLVNRWKTGFYHIAKGANVPIVLGYVDAKRKVVGAGDIFTLTDDMEADMQTIQSYYKQFTGINSR